MTHWILRDREPVEATLLEWAEFFERIENRRVAHDIVDGHRVSTVFLGLDHRFDGEGPPLLFETMVFNADASEGVCLRCSTWAEAEAQHARILTEVKLTARADG